jgi:hypothetical protein
VTLSTFVRSRRGNERAFLTELVEFVTSNESRPIFYSVYLTPDGTGMTVLQVHPDSASMEFHMRAGASRFPKFTELVDLSAMEIFGKP